LRLINQLLDLAKLESGTLKVEKSMNDLNSFISVIIGSFSSLAYQKNIIITSELPAKRFLVRFDKGKVETIVINLINNAIKFTPGRGSVEVSASLESGSQLVLSVADTGIGISVEQQEKVFERFHQVSEVHNEVGTGIGLSLVKELVVLMGGSISLKSEMGKGSVFTITLPIEQIRELTESEFLDRTEITNHNGVGPVGEDVPANDLDHLPYVLVVEDNNDLRQFIIDSLGKEFRFIEATDGKVGLEMAFEFIPDLILSDVMMPEMDGIAMTKKLKGDTRTSHIPLILLTAKTSDESKISALGTGADDYLTKPFNKNELLLKIRNRIALQTKLRAKIKLELLKESPKVDVQSADEKFLLKVKENILSRLSDEQLSVESLAVEIGLSRSQLLRKITALTGVSVNELIRTFRLQKAAQLLENNWGPVTQVAYEVGFSNLSYFSKVFKEQYGVLPSEFQAKNV
jgi:DNA-binding response OmpR family regulator/two-component sensor histidine kinase